MATTLMVSIKVADFAKWKAAFDEAAPMREKMGITLQGIYRDAEDPNKLALLSEYPSVEVAKAMLANPEWQERQKQAGVIGGFDVRFFDKLQ